MKGVKKELALVDGKPVLRIVTDLFAASGIFSHIVITYPKDMSDVETRYREVIGGIGIEPLFVRGGETRQESVFNGLNALASNPVDYVLIHDAARPWVSLELIETVFRGAKEYGACIPVLPHVDASKCIGPDGVITEHLRRGTIAGAQTPQGFRFADIFAAHKDAKAKGEEYPDDAEAYHHSIGPVHTVPGEGTNRKITYRYDV